ncbi:MAG TPA: outer membrane protein assembly factor BamE domain-containing protein [Candidatus Brocadiia bacterium]|nr:outer membrane protein assembly factor BamE [Candidatus Brocadiales bacterium]
MKKSEYIIMIIACILILSGCWSVGEKRIIQEETLSKLEIGKSTKEDVKTLLGKPLEVDFMTNGEEQWKYTYAHGKMKGTALIPFAAFVTDITEEEINTLTIHFSETGVLKKFGAGKMESGSGSVLIKK